MPRFYDTDRTPSNQYIPIKRTLAQWRHTKDALYATGRGYDEDVAELLVDTLCDYVEIADDAGVWIEFPPSTLPVLAKVGVSQEEGE